MDHDSTDPAVNPIVALAQRIRTRRDVGAAIDSAMPDGGTVEASDAGGALEAFAQALQAGVRRLNAILGKNGVTFIRLERPLRVRLRFREQRIALDLDEARQLVTVRGSGLDGDYQFAGAAGTLGLINLSKLSTEAGYGEPLTPSLLLKTLAQDAELPRPAHLDGSGPLQF
ncbi:MAG: hypothetical protein ACLPYS_00080 [Vulcanimicrobiaceae bacterium]